MASNFFLEVTSTKSGVVKGESMAKIAPGQIEVDNFKFEAERPIDLHTGSALGRITCKPFQAVLPVSSASAILLDIFFTNENIKTAKLTCYKAGSDGKPVKYLEWVLSDCRIVSYTIGNEKEYLFDTIQLVYAKSDFNYGRQKQDGSTENAKTATWYGYAPSTT